MMRYYLFILFSYVCFAVFSQENPYHHQADKLFYSGEYEEAFRLYGNAIKIDQFSDANYKLFLNAGDCAFFLNFKQIAFNYYGLSALRRAPVSDLTEHLRTYCGNDSDCILETLKKMAQKYPDAQDYLYPEIATILFNRSKYQMAIPILKECLFFRANNFFIQKMLAESFFNTGCTDSAYILYKKIVEYNFNDYDSYVFLGNYYYITANKFTKTIEVANAKRTKYLFLRKEEGKVNADTISEYYNKAAQYLEKAYTIDNNDEIKKSLIEIYTIIGNKDRIAFHRKEVRNKRNSTYK